MLALLGLSVVVLSAEPAPLKVAAPGFNVINLEARLGEFYTEHTAQQLKLLGLEVITVREIASMLGLERQRQLLGCSEGASGNLPGQQPADRHRGALAPFGRSVGADVGHDGPARRLHLDGPQRVQRHPQR